MSWIERAWRRVGRIFRRRQNVGPPPPPMPPPPVFYYQQSLARPRSALGGEQGPAARRAEVKRMRFQPPTPEALALIKRVLDEQDYSFREGILKGISISNPDFGSPPSNNLQDYEE